MQQTRLSESESSPVTGMVLTPELAAGLALADTLVTYDVTFRQTVCVNPNQLSARETYIPEHSPGYGRGCRRRRGRDPAESRSVL